MDSPKAIRIGAAQIPILGDLHQMHGPLLYSPAASIHTFWLNRTPIVSARPGVTTALLHVRPELAPALAARMLYVEDLKPNKPVPSATTVRGLTHRVVAVAESDVVRFAQALCPHYDLRPEALAEEPEPVEPPQKRVRWHLLIDPKTREAIPVSGFHLVKETK